MPINWKGFYFKRNLSSLGTPDSRQMLLSQPLREGVTSFVWLHQGCLDKPECQASYVNDMLHEQAGLAWMHDLLILLVTKTCTKH